MSKINQIRIRKFDKISKQAQSEIENKIKDKDDFSGYVQIFYGRDKSGLFVIKIEPIFGNILTKMHESIIYNVNYKNKIKKRKIEK